MQNTGRKGIDTQPTLERYTFAANQEIFTFLMFFLLWKSSSFMFPTVKPCGKSLSSLGATHSPGRLLPALSKTNPPEIEKTFF